MSEIPSYWQAGVLPTKLVNMQIGGQIRYLAKATTVAQILESYQVAQEHQLPVRILGGGSNIILPDEGFDGLLIKPQLLEKEIVHSLGPWQAAIATNKEEQQAQGRYDATEGEEFLKLHDEVAPSGETVYVRLGAGVPWGQAAIWTLTQGLIGFHLFARIPCVIGGSLYNNIHGGKHLLSEFVVAATVCNLKTGEEQILSLPELQLGYDTSIFHTQKHLVITSVMFALKRPEDAALAASAKDQYVAWTKDKTRVQPAGANCGSVFQNRHLTESDPGDAQTAAAWYIDQLGWRGSWRGKLQVFEGHANFIINHGGGTQADFIGLVKDIRTSVYERFNFWLTPEAECIGPAGETLVWQEGEAEPVWRHV